jgi:glycosyltransferase involved in cell wall biosynthesis
MGEAGMERVLRHFTWRTIAARTVDLYASLL